MGSVELWMEELTSRIIEVTRKRVTEANCALQGSNHGRICTFADERISIHLPMLMNLHKYRKIPTRPFPFLIRIPTIFVRFHRWWRCYVTISSEKIYSTIYYLKYLGEEEPERV